ncbi:MAG: rhomboid family intramembrane serine protease [archaeon]
MNERYKGYAFWIAGICVVLFLLQLVSGITDLFVLDASKKLEIWRYLTSIFLHGGLAHLFYNMFALILFGSILERTIGGKKFLIVYFVSGIIANIFAVFFYSSSLGASGAIFGIIGALVIIRPGMTVWAFSLPMPMFLAGILWAVGDLIGAVAFLSGSPISNTGNLAHLSGMAIGLILGAVYRDWSPKVRKQIHYVDENRIREWETSWGR